MLPSRDPAEVTHLLQTLPCRIVVPPWYQSLASQLGVANAIADDRRQFPRFIYPSKLLMEYRDSLPALPRPAEAYVVLCKDISRNGIGFLHAEPLYPSEKILLWLPTGRRTYCVRRCRRHNERCYEIGAD